MIDLRAETPIPPFTSFDYLGIADRFSPKNKIGEVSFTDLIHLPGVSDTDNPAKKFYLCAITNPFQNTVGETGKNYSLFMFAEKENEIEPIGHIDFLTKDKNPSEADFWDIGNLPLELTRSIDLLPPYIQKAVALFCPENKKGLGMEVISDYRHKVFGRDLWLFGLGYMEEQKAKWVRIAADSSSHLSGTGRSFYEKWGARSFTIQRKDVYGKPGHVVEKVALTHLPYDYEAIVATTLGIDLLRSESNSGNKI
ncbi:hypothetical protein HY029_04880 [Candidatus Gottesmanbacteria bacterium]|nr:hypothetical protein [Candidatus Gottesmanbacteria bacterium]